ncbi:MAG: alpha/beta fold hydrolase [Rhodocyclales bacterium]|nr:alpha/beta fold hydrolase [Rhodocyclales bacterium]
MTFAIQQHLGPAGFYEKHGEDAVLLVHGLTGTPAEMRSVAKRLTRQGFSVMCPQLAGHCGSVGALKRSKWQDWYKTVESAFEALKLTHERVYVTGLSMGALMALKLAEEKGSRVSGLGLLSATFFYDGWNIPHHRRRWLLPVVLYSPLRYFVSWKETAPYGIKCERTRAMVHAILTNRDAQTAEKIGIFRTPAVTILESVRLIRATRKALPGVHVPTLIVHANEDDMASVKNAHYVAKWISSSKVETFFVDDSYHVLTLDKRKYDIAHRLADFFRGCTARQLASA